jgi:hypothetical protein
MSDCAVPGRTIVLPSHYEVREYEGSIAEQIGMNFHFDYSLDHVIGRYLPESARHERYERFGPLPQIAKIPEGAEAEASARLAALKHFRAAMPDFLVRPLAAVNPNAVSIAYAISKICCHPGCHTEGEGCTIAVLDTGIEPSALTHGSAVHGIQYDVRTPGDTGSPPKDARGHGTLVAYIANAIAPKARIISIKTIHHTGFTSDVLAGMYLSQIVGPADILNLSLRVSCQAELCRVCRASLRGTTNAEQLQLFYKAFQAGAPEAILVAAAGNGCRNVAFPAAIAGVVAVGEFDHMRAQPISLFDEVPADRFVLAPGGRDDFAGGFGWRQGHAGAVHEHGSSYAAAFVSGAAALYVACDRSHASPFRSGSRPLVEDFLEYLGPRCDRAWPGYDPASHGVGALTSS